MVLQIGKVADLIAADFGSISHFVPIDHIMQLAHRLGLKGHDIAYFTTYAIAVGQMGRKQAVTSYDKIFGREGQKNRSKYSSLLNKELGKINLDGFYSVDIFDEITTQIREFKPCTNEEEAKAIFADAEQRQTKRNANRNPLADMLQNYTQVRPTPKSIEPQQLQFIS